MNIKNKIIIRINKMVLYVAGNFKDIVIAIFMVYFILDGFYVIAEVVCAFGHLNRIQSQICYNIVNVIGCIGVWCVGVVLRVKKYKYLKYLILMLTILAICEMYKNYLFSMCFEKMTMALIIYIFKPGIYYILLVIGYIMCDVCLKIFKSKIK